MLDRSVSYFLSEYWRNSPLYAEKIIPLLDTCLSSNFVLSDKVAKAFYELANKYQNTAELPLENLKEFIREQGYGYILDLVVQNEDTVKLLWYMLILIHQLKGSKDGLLLVLSLFEDNFDPTRTKITEWHEMNPVGRPHTFSLETAVDISKLGDGFFKKFEKFIANYVYPEMLALKINYSIDGRITYRPYARVRISSKVDIASMDGFNCGGVVQPDFFDVYDGGGAFEGYLPATILSGAHTEINPSTQEHYPVGTDEEFSELIYIYNPVSKEYETDETVQYVSINGGRAKGVTWLINGQIKGWTGSRNVTKGAKVGDYTTLTTDYWDLDKLGEVEYISPDCNKFMYKEEGGTNLHECIFYE